MGTRVVVADCRWSAKKLLKRVEVPPGELEANETTDEGSSAAKSNEAGRRG
jgi:hypothetical protein